MGTIFREINTYFYEGPDDPNRPRREWKEVDEEEDIINSKESFDRIAELVHPLALLRANLPGDGPGKQVPIFVSDDVRIEMMTSTAAAEEDSRAPDGWHEVRIQVENTRTIKAGSASYDLELADLLVIPPGVTYDVAGDGPSTQLVIYTRRPLGIAEGFPYEEGKTAVNGKTGACLLVRPAQAAPLVQEGASGGAHFKLVENEDLMIESTFRSDDQKLYHRGFGKDEMPFQLTGERISRTTQGDFVTVAGDLLMIPPGTSHRNIGNTATIRNIMYAKSPLHVPDEYRERAKAVEAMGVKA
jgi:mannose-6-phosphate isomerase-like protein (cupin superfamily)